MSSMAVYSMTGYAGASASLGSALTSDAEGETSTKTHATGGINIELRSVNSRFLDLVLRLPDELRGLEPALRELVTQSFRRGKIELRTLLETDADSVFHQSLRAAQGERGAGVSEEMPWQVVDVYLNDAAYWKNIPLPVWEFTMGGYQVIKKWLSYREHRVLGRALKPEEITDVQNIARRIAALVLLQPKLDANYASVTANVYPFPLATH